MNQLDAIKIFVRVAEAASFTQAAADLGLPKASTSLAVQWLENQTGIRLLHRTTRRVQMTQDGQVFYQRCLEWLADAEELQDMFRIDPADVRGRLRVDMSVGAVAGIVMARLPEFMARYPNVEVELGATDHLVDIVAEGFDCVMRAGTISDSRLVARRLGAYRQLNCVSPAYAAVYGIPQTLADLAEHRLIHYALSLGSKPAGFEYVDAASGEVRNLPMAGNLTVNSSIAYFSACLAGLGMIQGPEPNLEPYLRRGELIEVLPDYRAEPLPVTLLYSNRRHLSRRVQVFMCWLEGVMTPHLQALAPSRP
ncbi:LysR family transcriptional regulator [Methylomonas sp. CM2]|uniref:LysR family transcriptional regulator n=1 Tax=Methylomonas sp. CM2 TaxID=3417647 RepID=UPI003CF411F2